MSAKVKGHEAVESIRNQLATYLREEPYLPSDNIQSQESRKTGYFYSVVKDQTLGGLCVMKGMVEALKAKAGNDDTQKHRLEVADKRLDQVIEIRSKGAIHGGPLGDLAVKAISFAVTHGMLEAKQIESGEVSASVERNDQVQNLAR